MTLAELKDRIDQTLERGRPDDEVRVHPLDGSELPEDNGHIWLLAYNEDGSLIGLQTPAFLATVFGFGS